MLPKLPESMVKNILLLVIAVLTAGSTLAQDEAKKDTIYLLGQRKMIVEVKGIFYSNIKYKDPETGEIKSMETKNIQRIIFDSGRKEVFNKPLVGMINKTDWKNVVLTRKKGEVEGLYEVGRVKGRSAANNRTVKSAERTAVIRMKKRAANMGAEMILVTKEESRGGFGEVPTFYIEGVAYAFEPPEENE